MSSSVSVSLRCRFLKTTNMNFTKLWCTLPVAVVRFSVGGIAIRYVLPVSWTTSFLQLVAGRSRHQKACHAQRLGSNSPGNSTGGVV